MSTTTYGTAGDPHIHIASYTMRDLIRGEVTQIDTFEGQTVLGPIYTVRVETSIEGTDHAGSIRFAEFDGMDEALSWAADEAENSCTLPTNGNVPVCSAL